MLAHSNIFNTENLAIRDGLPCNLHFMCLVVIMQSCCNCLYSNIFNTENFAIRDGWTCNLYILRLLSWCAFWFVATLPWRKLLPQVMDARACILHTLYTLYMFRFDIASLLHCIPTITTFPLRNARPSVTEKLANCPTSVSLNYITNNLIVFLRITILPAKKTLPVMGRLAIGPTLNVPLWSSNSIACLLVHVVYIEKKLIRNGWTCTLQTRVSQNNAHPGLSRRCRYRNIAIRQKWTRTLATLCVLMWHCGVLVSSSSRLFRYGKHCHHLAWACNLQILHLQL